MSETKIFCAIDHADFDTALQTAKTAGQATGAIKLGLTFFNRNGPEGISRIMEQLAGVDLFLDLKCHDIPMQVAGAVRNVVRLAPRFVTLHASGGAEMMRQAAAAVAEEAQAQGVARPQLLAITVLTSLDDAALADVGQQTPAADQVIRLAKLAKASGIDGVVCSPKEVAMIREACGPDFVIMVPGIRPAGSSADDQARVMTPSDAVQAGASHLVIGRPITRAEDPQEAASSLYAEISQAQANAA